MKHLKVYNKQDILSLTHLRKFETRIGERLQVISNAAELEQSIKQSAAKVVLIGVIEDIGDRANTGAGNSNNQWLSFLRSLFDMQSNDFFDGDEVLMIGHFDFTELHQLIESNAHDTEERLLAYRHAVTTIDDEVEQLVHMITQNNKLPVVIGGGHNNAYPCIKGAAKGWYKAGVLPLAQINAINLDKHTGYLPLEGRHSGNSFRYAEEDGYLEKYCVIGVHETYIPQNVWLDMVNNPFIDCMTYEDIFIHEKRNLVQSVIDAAGFTTDTLCGIELNMASLVSNGCSGITARDARQYIDFATTYSKPAYLHISDSGELQDTDENGKLWAYLLVDFVKALGL